MKCIQYILSFAVVRDDQILMRISGNELTWNQGSYLLSVAPHCQCILHVGVKHCQNVIVETLIEVAC